MAKRFLIVSKDQLKQLAFWETLIDYSPIAYLNPGEKVELISDRVYYGGIHGDKEYYKVNHSLHGVGYMLKAGLVGQNQNA